MNKNADRTITLDKGRVDIYQQNGITCTPIRPGTP